MNPLNAYLAQSVMADRYALAEARRRVRTEHPARSTRRYESVTIRRVTPGDRRAIERLAQLEGRPAPPAEALLAQAGEHVLAVYSLHDGTTLADPFEPTAELVSLLKARARQIGGAGTALARPVRRVASRIAAFYS